MQQTSLTASWNHIKSLFQKLEFIYNKVHETHLPQCRCPDNFYETMKEIEHILNVFKIGYFLKNLSDAQSENIEQMANLSLEDHIKVQELESCINDHIRWLTDVYIRIHQ